MGTLESRIKELIQFYVKTNYEAYLSQHKLQYIDDNKIRDVVKQLYTEKKRTSQSVCQTIFKTNAT